MIPILIKKDPNRYDNLPYNLDDFLSVINGVDLYDITDYITSISNDRWAPRCYWPEGQIYRGQLYWVIYSYLVHNKLLIVEDCYFGYNRNRTEKYKNRTSYYNPLENDLYQPILSRMVNEKYLIEDSNYYIMGSSYWRIVNLSNLII